MEHKKLLFVSLVMMAISTTFAMGQNDKKIDFSFCHQVYFWLNNPDDPQNRAEFEKGIQELLKIAEIKAFHFGTPANTTHRDVVDGTYTYSYTVFFEHEEAQDTYQEHPVHQKFVEKYKHFWAKVKVYDAVMQ